MDETVHHGNPVSRPTSEEIRLDPAGLSRFRLLPANGDSRRHEKTEA